MADDSIKGTKFKLNVRMEPIDGKYHLSNIDWEVELSTRKVGSKAQIIKKEQARKVTDDDYIIVVDSSIGGIFFSPPSFRMLTARMVQG